MKQALYFPPGQAAIGATTYQNINPKQWLTLGSGLSGCVGGAYPCLEAGDYQGVASNPYAAASLPMIDDSPFSSSSLLQQFVQDPGGEANAPNFRPNFVEFPEGANLSDRAAAINFMADDRGRWASSLFIMSHGGQDPGRLQAQSHQ